jgi:uncharacterized protein (DUF2147 family)
LTARIKRAGFLLAALALLANPLCSQAADNPSDAILGVWQTTDNASQVQIFKQTNRYFGKIISLKEPNWPAHSKLGTPGTPKNDRNNPDPALRKQPVIGLQIMSNFGYVGKDCWTGGQMYDPKSGKTYHGKITLTATNRLELRGYIGISLLGRTVVWTR